MNFWQNFQQNVNNGNFAKCMQAISMTAFTVGLTGMAMRNRNCGSPSIFNLMNQNSQFPNMMLNQYQNPYGFLNTYNVNQNQPLTGVRLSSPVDNVNNPDLNSQVQIGTADLQKNVGKAQEFLQEHLKTLSDADLEKLGITSEKRDRLLKYIANIKYEDDPLHDTMHGGNKDDGYAITVNTKLKGSNNLANMVTMLVHEANHCDEAYLRDNPNESEIGDLRHRDSNGNPITAPEMNTKWEEKACETLGVMTCAVLIDKGELPNYSRYNNHQFTEYLNNPDLLNNDIEEWCNEGYTNYVDDFEGNMTIEHMKMKGVNVSEADDTKIQIKKGDIVKIGTEEFPIGNGTYLRSGDSAPIFGFPELGIAGAYIVFDKVEPTQSEKKKVGLENITPTDQTVEIIRDGKVVYTGKVYKE